MAFGSPYLKDAASASQRMAALGSGFFEFSERCNRQPQTYHAEWPLWGAREARSAGSALWCRRQRKSENWLEKLRSNDGRTREKISPKEP